MKIEVLKEVEKNLAEVTTEITKLRDKFAEKFRGEHTDETLKIEAEKIALEESREQLIAMIAPITVMCNGGIMADAKKQVKKVVKSANFDRKMSNLINATADPTVIPRFA